MEIEKIKRPSAKAERTIAISVKITKGQSEWMAKNKISPTLLVSEAINELMSKTQ